MIATKNEMMSRRLSRDWNKPILMTKRQRLKEDKEMHGTSDDFAKGLFMYLLLLRECHYNIQQSTENEKGSRVPSIPNLSLRESKQ